MLPGKKSNVKFKKILKICQVNALVYIIQEGMTIDIVHAQSYVHLQSIESPFTGGASHGDLIPCEVSYIQSLNILLVLFKNGHIGTLSLPSNSLELTEVTSGFQYQVISCITKKDVKLLLLGIDRHFLCMELVTSNDKDNEKCEVWCGCDNSSIIITSLKSLVGEESLQSHTISNIADSACKVIQLKTVSTFYLQVVCALLDIGNIYCYDADTRDCLTCIPASTGNQIF